MHTCIASTVQLFALWIFSFLMGTCFLALNLESTVTFKVWQTVSSSSVPKAVQSSIYWSEFFANFALCSKAHYSLHWIFRSNLYLPSLCPFRGYVHYGCNDTILAAATTRVYGTAILYGDDFPWSMVEPLQIDWCWASSHCIPFLFECWVDAGCNRWQWEAVSRDPEWSTIWTGMLRVENNSKPKTCTWEGWKSVP